MHQIDVYLLLWNGLFEWIFLSLILFVRCSMEGGELFNRIRDRQDKPYTEREAANIILMIAKAVGHLHHMDIVKRIFILYIDFYFIIFLGSS
jgi:serine/threonine protein kinase